MISSEVDITFENDKTKQRNQLTCNILAYRWRGLQLEAASGLGAVQGGTFGYIDSWGTGVCA